MDNGVMLKMRGLVDKLNHYAKLYYEQDAPVISDGEYDALYDSLRDLESQTGTVLPDSPTRRVGGQPLKSFKQFKHSHKLYSLDKCQTKDELLRWFERTQKLLGHTPTVSVEYKYDGLTLNLTYENGLLQSAATRGNGEVGEDVTIQVSTIKTVPLSIPYKGRVEVQGEGIMRLSVLEKYNESSAEPLKNARNGAAGAIRNLDPKVTAARNLDIMCYNVYGVDGIQTQQQMQDFLLQNGFETGGYFKIAQSADAAAVYCAEIEKSRPNLDFLIDGAVIKVDDVALRADMGETEKFPRWAVAFKFKPEEATTVVENVIWQVSRTSKLNPLAILTPVDLAGVTVKRATLNNYADLQKKGIKIGSRVFIRRSNDVIPEITGVAEHTEKSREVAKPTECPYCHSPVREEGAFIFCTNKETCAPQIIAKLTHFASKPAMNVEGFSEKTAELLLNERGVDSFDKLYSLSANDLTGLDGFAELKISNLLSAIEKSKKVSLSNFIYALGIKNIGKKAAKQLASAFKSLSAIKSATKDELLNLDDFGEIMAADVENYYKNTANLEQLDKLFALGVQVEDEKTVSGSFTGINAVLTGSLESLKRSQAEKLIVDKGGAVSASVSKAVNLVIAGEDAGSKLQKAQKLNIRIISETEFLDMLKK